MAIEELLQQAEQHYWHGQFPEALHLLEQLDTQEEVTKFKRLQGQLLCCRIYALLDIKKAQELADHIIQASQDMNQPLIEMDALLVMAEAWLELGKINTSWELLEQGKAILDNFIGVKTSDVTEREATILMLEGVILSFKGELDRAIIGIQNSLALREKLNLPQAIAQSLYYLGIAYLHQGKYENSMDCFQQSLTFRKRVNNSFKIVQSLYYLGRTYANIGNHKLALEYYQKSLTIREQLGIRHEIAHTLAYLAGSYTYRGKLDLALQLLQNSLKICQQLNIPGTSAEARAYQVIGYIYIQKGDLELALKVIQKGLTLEEARGVKSQIGYNLGYLGRIYLKKGHLEAAYQALVKSVEILEDVAVRGNILAISLVYLVLISLAQNNLESASHHVQQLVAIREIDSSIFVDHGTRLAQALLLKESPRIRNKLEAQKIFQILAEEDVTDFDFTALASLNFCELLFYEFKSSEDPGILSEIRMVTNRLLDLAHAQQMPSVLVETYFLQAKLALLELDVSGARQIFSQAQALAEDKGLEKIARSISHEHDTLLAQLPHWEALQRETAPIVKTREMSEVEDLLSRMIRQRAPDPPDPHPEVPALFLILSEGGLPLYSYPFAGGPNIDEHLIGGFLTALTAFGQDALAATGVIDRITYEDYTSR